MLWPLRGFAAAAGSLPAGNFRYIYADPKLRGDFRQFLVNVFHLYPEDRLHALIERLSSEHTTDEMTYRELQGHLDAIKPFLGDLTYALPALRKQKDEMTRQTTLLIDSGKRYDGYLELGSNGRYLDALEEELNIVGERFFVSERAPTNALTDILDRGQFSRGGQYIPLDDYRMDLSGIAPASLDLVTVYIGFHHCPVDLREAFITEIRDTMRPGADLVVRDHNAHNEDIWRLVALAHDVFNMGTKESWTYNARERRHFYALTTLHDMLTRTGFKTDGRQLLQNGDPTLNTLMAYQKG